MVMLMVVEGLVGKAMGRKTFQILALVNIELVIIITISVVPTKALIDIVEGTANTPFLVGGAFAF